MAQTAPTPTAAAPKESDGSTLQAGPPPRRAQPCLHSTHVQKAAAKRLLCTGCLYLTCLQNHHSIRARLQQDKDNPFQIREQEFPQRTHAHPSLDPPRVSTVGAGGPEETSHLCIGRRRTFQPLYGASAGHSHSSSQQSYGHSANSVFGPGPRGAETGPARGRGERADGRRHEGPPAHTGRAQEGPRASTH